MSDPENQSHAPEDIVWTGSISHWHYAGRWLLVLLLLAATLASFAYLPVSEWQYIWPARGAAAVLAVIIVIGIAVARRLRRYTISTRRVIVEFGLVDKRSNEIRIQDIRSINLFCSGFLGMLGIGRVEFSSAAADDAEVIFWQVAGAEKIRDRVRSLQTR